MADLGPGAKHHGLTIFLYHIAIVQYAEFSSPVNSYPISFDFSSSLAAVTMQDFIVGNIKKEISEQKKVNANYLCKKY